jgi:hypothetical protein
LPSSLPEYFIILPFFYSFVSKEKPHDEGGANSKRLNNPSADDFKVSISSDQNSRSACWPIRKLSSMT